MGPTSETGRPNVGLESATQASDLDEQRRHRCFLMRRSWIQWSRADVPRADFSVCVARVRADAGHPPVQAPGASTAEEDRRRWQQEAERFDEERRRKEAELLERERQVAGREQRLAEREAEMHDDRRTAEQALGLGVWLWRERLASERARHFRSLCARCARSSTLAIALQLCPYSFVARRGPDCAARWRLQSASESTRASPFWRGSRRAVLCAPVRHARSMDAI